MADLSRTNWSTSDTPVLATVLNNIGLDIRTAGANRDMGGYSIVNCASISGPTSGRVGFGISAALTARVHVRETTDVPVLLAHQNSNAGGSSITAQIQDDRGYSGATNGDVLRVGAWTAYGGTGNILNVCSTNGSVSSLFAVKMSGLLYASNVPSYASNAAAITGGLTAGMFYRNGDAVCIVH